MNHIHASWFPLLVEAVHQSNRVREAKMGWCGGRGNITDKQRWQNPYSKCVHPVKSFRHALPAAITDVRESSLMWEFFKETNTAPQRPNMWCLNCQNIDFHVLHPSRKEKFRTWKTPPLLKIAQEFFSSLQGACWWSPLGITNLRRAHFMSCVKCCGYFVHTVCPQQCPLSTAHRWTLTVRLRVFSHLWLGSFGPDGGEIILLRWINQEE